MSSASEIVLDYVCPGLGVIMASAMFAAPIKSLQEAIERGSLGDLNPTPWAFMTGNCLGWVAYSYLTKDLFVLFANAPGLLLSIWLNFGAVKLQYYDYFSKNVASSQRDGRLAEDMDGSPDEREEDTPAAEEMDVAWAEEEMHNKPSGPSVMPHEKKVLRISLLWVIVLSLVGLTTMTREKREEIIGVVVNINLAFFYGAPLSTIATVFRTRSSTSIHVKTMIMTLTNTAFWLAYGLARWDPYIFIPNGVGFVLGCIQALLSILFPRKGGHRQGLQPIGDSADELDLSEEFLDEEGGNKENAESCKTTGGDDSEIV